MVDYNEIGQKQTKALIASLVQARAEILEKYGAEQGSEKNWAGWHPYIGYWKIKD